MKLTVKLTSVTYAIKARDVLRRQGIKATFRKNPKPENGEGCGYVLTVSNAPENTLQILTFNGIDIKESQWGK